MTLSESRIEPTFIDGPAGRLFTLYLAAPTDPRAALLYLPPFGEEMNRCRATVAHQARRFTELGYSCLLLDPFGTGDSEGDLKDASWEIWIEDALTAADWLQQRDGSDVYLWGLRTGALLAASVSDRVPGRFARLLLWQPVQDARMFMTQYLRLRVAALMERGLPKQTTDELRAALRSGQTLEVAGYELSAKLVDSMDGIRLRDLAGLTRQTIDWLELVGEPGGALPPPSKRLIAQLAAQDCTVNPVAFCGPPIWQLHKRDEVPELIEATTTLFRSEA